MATPYDLLLKGGTVVDPSQGLHSGADVAIKSGRVAAVAEGIPADQAARTIDVSGKMVTPGIIDLHCHFFWGVGNGVDADKDCLPRGTTTVVDGGSSGANSFQGFRRYVLERIRTRAFALLNLSTTGMVDLRTSEFGCLTHADVGAAVRTIEQHRDLIIRAQDTGIQLRRVQRSNPLHEAGAGGRRQGRHEDRHTTSATPAFRCPRSCPT